MLAEPSGATACRMRRNGTSLLAANIRHHLEMEHCHCGPMCHGATASFSSQTTIRSSQETLRHSSTVVLHGSLGARLGKLRFKIGRASGRERVCQYVSIPVGPLSLKKK